MKLKNKVLLTISIVILLIPMILTMHLYNLGFRVRVDNSTNYYNYIKTIHKNFMKQETSFKSDKGQLLSGAFYRYPNKTYKALIVMPHGMGGGHDGYIAEAEYLARNGYIVFSYDNTGTNDSDGKNLKGLEQAPIDLNSALIYTNSIQKLSNLDTMLYGHSWGGYAVTSVNNFNHDIKAIVSVSGFQDTLNVIQEQGKNILGEKINWFIPYVKFYEKILFGKNSNLNGIDGLKNTDSNVLIIHSEDDPVVSFENYLQYYNEFKNNDRFKFLKLSNNGHNAVLDTDSNKKIQQIQKELKINPNNQTLINDEYKLILNLNENIMQTILAFFDENL